MIAATGRDEPVRIVLATTAATVLVFWLAHVYAEVVGMRLDDGRLGLTAVPAAMTGELPMLEAPAVSLLFLLLGAAGVLDADLAVGLALWNGVVQLVGWGIIVGRRRGRSWPAALLSGVIDGAFGVAIVVLEVLLH